MHSLRLNIIKVALADVGYVEEQRLNPVTGKVQGNYTKFGERFGVNFEPWCAISVSEWYTAGGAPLSGFGVHEYTRGFAGVPWLVKNFSLKRVDNPLPGDIVVYDWDGNGSPDHTGLFTQWLDHGPALGAPFVTIEGNVSPTNQSNGGMVQVKIRELSPRISFYRFLPV